MKQSHTFVIATVFGTACLAMADSQVHKTADGHATAEAHATANGNKSSVSKQSVTVTSDGNQTIKKTVTVRDGKEETVTEITDALGNVTRQIGNDNNKSGPANGHNQTGGAQNDGGPWLGVRVQAAPPALRDQLGLANDEGVVVEVVASNSPAARVGIRVNDTLLAVDQTKLSTPENLRDELRKHQVGDTVTLSLMRKGAHSTEDVILGQKPDTTTGKDSNPPPPTDPQTGDDNSRKDEIHLEVQDGNAGATAGAGLDAVLNDPNVSEEFKKTVREMKEKMREFEAKHGANK